MLGSAAVLTVALLPLQEFLQWVMRKAQPRSQCMHPSLHEQGPEERSQRLEQRLAAAEANRQSNLAAVQLKARASTERGSQVTCCPAVNGGLLLWELCCP